MFRLKRQVREEGEQRPLEVQLGQGQVRRRRRPRFHFRFRFCFRSAGKDPEAGTEKGNGPELEVSRLNLKLWCWRRLKWSSAELRIVKNRVRV